MSSLTSLTSSRPIHPLNDYTNALQGVEVAAFLTGGFAEVRKVSTPEHGLLAIKTVKYRGDASEEQMKQEVRREIDIWGTCNHPNILPLMGVCTLSSQPSYPSLVSQWVSNGTCRPIRDPHLRDLKSIILGVCRALSYLESCGIIHADLHARNVMLSSSWEPLLSDFGGSVRASDSLDDCSTGISMWSAPELISGSITAASDIWSLGLLIYEIATQSSVFKNMTAPMHLISLSNRTLPINPTGDAEFLVNLPDSLIQVSINCRNMDPSARPTAKELISQLQSM